MDQNTQPEMNNVSPITESPIEAPHKKNGPMIATLAAILIVVIAALYLFASRAETPTLPTEEEPTAEVQAVTNMSDDVTSLEADINTSIEGLEGQNF